MCDVQIHRGLPAPNSCDASARAMLVISHPPEEPTGITPGQEKSRGFTVSHLFLMSDILILYPVGYSIGVLLFKRWAKTTVRHYKGGGGGTVPYPRPAPAVRCGCGVTSIVHAGPAQGSGAGNPPGLWISQTWKTKKGRRSVTRVPTPPWQHGMYCSSSAHLARRWVGFSVTLYTFVLY